MAIIKINRKRGACYQVKLRGSDNKWITKVFNNRKGAEDFEINLRQKRMRGGQVTNGGNQVTLDQYFNEWFDAVQHQATPGWRKIQKGLFEKYVKPRIGEIKLVAVTPPMVARVLSNMALLHRSPQLQLHVYAMLRKMFSDAVELFEILSRNPVIKKLRPKVPQKESRYLSIDEIRRLLVHAAESPYEIPIWLGIYLGLRVGEIQALKWEDVDLELGILHVRRSYSKSERVFREYPKGKKHHSHRIPFELLSLLRKRKETARSELVVMPPGFQMLNYCKYRKALRRYCAEIGITSVATHGLRHSTAEVYMSHGATRDDLRILFAHSSASTTDRYIHDRGGRLERVAEVIQLLPTCSMNVPQNGVNQSPIEKEVRELAEI